MTDQQQDPRRQVRAQQRQVARAEGAADVEAMTLQVDRALGAIRSDAFWTDIIAALPRQIDGSWFRQVATTAIMGDPRLLGADKRSLTLALMHCARLGLMPVKGYGEVALFVDGKNQVQWRTEYGGVLHLVRNSGMVPDIDAQPVFENDRCTLRVGRMPEHEIPLTGRGALIGAYAYARLANSEHVMIEYQDWESIWRHAQRYSDAIRQNRDTPWKDPEAQPAMACKTVLHRLMRMLPKSPQVASVMAHEYELDRAENARDVTQPAPALPVPQPHGWGRQFGAGNGHTEDVAAQSRQETHQRAPSAPRTEIEPERAAPVDAPQAQTTEPRKRGRPSKQELAARDRAKAEDEANRIIGNIHMADPTKVSDILDDEQDVMRDLPDDLRTEVVSAAHDRMADEDEYRDAEPAGGPLAGAHAQPGERRTRNLDTGASRHSDDEPPLADEHGEPVQQQVAIDEVEYKGWYKARRAYAMALPTIAHLNKYRPEEVAAARERYGDDAADHIDRLFDEAEARLKGGGR